MFLTETERIEILMILGFGDRRRTQQEVCIIFNETHPDRQPISQSTVCKLEKKFNEHGHVRDIKRPGRPSTDDDVQLHVLLSVQEKPHTSLTALETKLDISRSTAWRILHRNKYHPYKVQPLQELMEDDFDRRLQFCESMTDICNRNLDFVSNVLFSDEASFCLNGEVNRQNCRYWSTKNPRWMEETHTQHHEKINVWAGIVGTRVVGPYFFDETLTGDRYLEFLREVLIPSLAVLYPNLDDPDVPNDSIWYQQDGAPPHYAVHVRRYLEDVFPNRWIGRRGFIEWPARSPDLSPLDYFLWGYLKCRVFVTKPANMEELKLRITTECRNIPPAVIENVQQEFTNRLSHCQIVNGEHFEHIIK